MRPRAWPLVWALVAVTLCLRADLWDRALGADNRLYFYMAERVAAGVPPHVSAPDVKNQLATVAAGASIAVGRSVGLDDVRSGRLAALATLVAGVCAVGLLVFELGGSVVAAGVGAVSTLASGALVEHTAIGFNPKVLLFALIAWTNLLIARSRFGAAGVAAAAAMLCWQPAVAVCVAAVVAALVQAPRGRRTLRVALGGIAAVALYEAYFAWHGALLPQLFQAGVLPLGSVHETVDLREGLSFVAFCERRGLDRFGVPAAAFALFVVGCTRSWLRRSKPAGSSDAITAAAAAPALVAVIVGGLLSVAFTFYDHQAEPDRFLLSAYFATALGMVVDRGMRLVRSLSGPSNVLRIEGALVALLLLLVARTSGTGKQSESALERQYELGRIVRLYADGYGGVWAFGCSHLLGLAHMTNYHPLGYLWDDLEAYVKEEPFAPVVDGQLPGVILAGRRIPGRDLLVREYTEVSVPALRAERVRLYVRKSARIESQDVRDVGPRRLPRSGSGAPATKPTRRDR